jgi:hypothetical protein
MDWQEGAYMVNSQEIKARLQAVKQLAALFRVERYVYIAITVISFLLLLAVAVRMYMQGVKQDSEWGLMFGSSGLISFTGNRIIQIWMKVTDLVIAEPKSSSSRGVAND